MREGRYEERSLYREHWCEKRLYPIRILVDARSFWSIFYVSCLAFYIPSFSHASHPLKPLLITISKPQSTIWTHSKPISGAERINKVQYRVRSVCCESTGSKLAHSLCARPPNSSEARYSIVLGHAATSGEYACTRQVDNILRRRNGRSIKYDRSCRIAATAVWCGGCVAIALWEREGWGGTVRVSASPMNVERTILGANNKELTSDNKFKKGLTGPEISKTFNFAQDINICTKRGLGSKTATHTSAALQAIAGYLTFYVHSTHEQGSETRGSRFTTLFHKKPGSPKGRTLLKYTLPNLSPEILCHPIPTHIHVRA